MVNSGHTAEVLAVIKILIFIFLFSFTKAGNMLNENIQF